MIIKKPYPFDVFTGGYFSETGKYDSPVSVFTGGAFQGVYSVVLEQTTNNIDYSTNKIIFNSPLVLKPSIIDFRSQSPELVIKKSFNYNRFSKLPNQYLKKCSSRYQNDRELFANLQMEKTNIFGTKVTYYRLEINESKNVYGEDNVARIVNHWDDVMIDYPYQRENKMWRITGIEYDETLDVSLSKKHFDYMSGGIIPQTGDIIHVIYNNMIYEVVDKNEDKASLFQSKMYNWDLVLKPLKKKSLIFLDSQKDTYLYSVLKSEDVLDVSSVIENKKSDVVYSPLNGEKSIQNPFAGM